MQQPDQRGLYEYHCSYEEYLELQQLLVQLGSFDLAVEDMASSAYFVLFAQSGTGVSTEDRVCHP